MRSPTAYRMSSYGDMISCEPRMSAYADALRKAITPGCRVIDIGAGPGAFSILACQYGAGSVVAIEPDNVIELLPEIAAANGFRDRITIFKGLSSDYVDPVRADVIISDIRSILPLFEGHIATIVDARQRLLVPGGALIPARDRLRIALVRNPASYSPIEHPWQSNRFDLDLSAGRRFVVNEWSKVELSAEALLSVPEDLATLDYTTIVDRNLTASSTLTATQDGIAHGFVIWFDADLGPDIGFSNAPGEPTQIYGQGFFPFEQAVQLSQGERVVIEFRATMIDGCYVYSWNTRIDQAGGKKLAFRQSAFQSRVHSPRELAHQSSDHVPPVHADHEVDCFCIARMDGVANLGAIADAAMTRFPDRFRSTDEALRHVARLSARYGSRPGKLL